MGQSSHQLSGWLFLNGLERSTSSMLNCSRLGTLFQNLISKLDFKSLKELIVNRFTPHTRRWNGLRSVGYAFGKMSHTICFTSIPWMMTGSSALTYRRGQDEVRDGH